MRTRTGLFCSVLAGLLATAPLGAESLMPLAPDNYWEFACLRFGESVATPDNQVVAARIEVHDPVWLPSVRTDTTLAWPVVNSSPSEGSHYLRVSLRKFGHLWPYTQPDTLFAREDDDGRVWAKGYVIDGKARLTALEQLWLGNQEDWQWNLRLDDRYLSIGYISCMWVGLDELDPEGVYTCGGAPRWERLVAGRGSVAGRDSISWWPWRVTSIHA